MANFGPAASRLRFAAKMKSALEQKMMQSAIRAYVLIAAVSLAGIADAGRQGEVPGTFKLSPEEAGARYGQALGAGRLCKGFKVLPGADELAATFKGVELATFQKAAARIVEAWQATTNCQAGPNVCMRSHLASCFEAFREIGPEGSRYPGLIGYSSD